MSKLSFETPEFRKELEKQTTKEGIKELFEKMEQK